jgi:plastocyanin
VPKQLDALVLLAAASVLVAGAGAPRPLAAQSAPGTIEGRVRFEPPPPRRTANRYPSGPAPAHPIQQLPAFAYVVGPVSGAPAGAASRATMVQRDTAFVPSVIAVLAGGTVSFPNEDPFFHNVFSYSSAQRFDLGRYPRGESKTVTFPEPGIVEVFCEVHEFMRGAIIVTENPHHSVVAADGSFRIANLPAGEHRVAFWHPDHKAVEQRVVVPAGGTARLEVELRR